jgi:hypothetical protein
LFFLPEGKPKVENQHAITFTLLNLKYRTGNGPSVPSTAGRIPAKLRIVRQSNPIRGENTVAKMTTQQKAAYKIYRKECRMTNVEPVRADFLAGDIPGCVQRQIELQITEADALTFEHAWYSHQLTMGASVGA